MGPLINTRGRLTQVATTPAFLVAQPIFAFTYIFLFSVLALDLEGVHDVKLHHPSSSVATSNQ